MSAPPRCAFEEYFFVSDPPSSSRQHLRVYPRVSEIIDASSEKATRLACESKPLHRVVPLRHRIFNVGDDQDFCSARFVNPDFSHISNSKSIPKSQLSISTLPSHIYSTILSYAKVPVTHTHSPTKTRNCCPSLLSSFPH